MLNKLIVPHFRDLHLWNCIRIGQFEVIMPTTKQILEIYHDDYVNSIKRNIDIIGKELASPQKKSFFTPAVVETLASHGLGMKVIAAMYGGLSMTISQDPIMLAAFEKGRANIASRVRASLVDDALNNDMPYAKMHLDKVLNKEDHVQQIDLNVTQNPLETVSDEQLLEIDIESKE